MLTLTCTICGTDFQRAEKATTGRRCRSCRQRMNTIYRRKMRAKQGKLTRLYRDIKLIPNTEYNGLLTGMFGE
jgi:hypothetical protein